MFNSVVALTILILFMVMAVGKVLCMILRWVNILIHDMRIVDFSRDPYGARGRYSFPV